MKLPLLLGASLAAAIGLAAQPSHLPPLPADLETLTQAEVDAYQGNEKPIITPLASDVKGMGIPSADDSLGIRVQHPDGRPWAGLPVRITVNSKRRMVSKRRNTPPYVPQITLLTNAAGIAKVYLQPFPTPTPTAPAK